jgi:hypothetical protein
MTFHPYFEKYVPAHSDALVNFQYLEQALREYIALAYKVIGLTSPHVPFRYSIEDLENDTLRRLIEKYLKVAPDPDLGKELFPLVKKRNHIAHRALIQDLDQFKTPKFTELKVEELKQVHSETEVAVEKILQQIVELTAIYKGLLNAA